MNKTRTGDIDSLSKWVKAVRSLTLKRMKVLNRSMSVNATSVFKDPDVAKTLSTIHDKYVVVPADKAQNNIVFVCKTFYIQCLLSEVPVENNRSDKTYTNTTLSKEEIVENHKSVLSSFGLQYLEPGDDWGFLTTFNTNTGLSRSMLVG